MSVTIGKFNRIKLTQMAKELQPASEYNRYLFSLYLKYINRFIVYPHQVAQAKNYKQMIENKDIPNIKSWGDIHQLAAQYHSIYGKPPNSGNPFIKTGKMLQELGVLPPKGKYNQHHFYKFSDEINAITNGATRSFINFLPTSHRSLGTNLQIIYIIKDFAKWMKWQNIELHQANQNMITGYLDYILSQGQKSSTKNQIFSYLNFYYRWQQDKGVMDYNPCTGLPTSNWSRQLLTCAPLQYKQLWTYIKNPNSDSQLAMILALILVWAFRNHDLCHAKLEFKGDDFKIIMPRIYKRGKHWNREQVLLLPQEPHWFLNLQHRFKSQWISHYQQLKKTFPHQYLMLAQTRDIRPLSEATMVNRVYQATLAATNQKIPLRVLRQTCGTIYAAKNERVKSEWA